MTDGRRLGAGALAVAGLLWLAAFTRPQTPSGVKIVAPAPAFAPAPGDWVYACFPDLDRLVLALAVMPPSAADAAKVVPIPSNVPRLPGGRRGDFCLVYR